MLGLHGYAGSSLVLAPGGCSLASGHRLLPGAASRLRGWALEHGFNICGAWSQLLQGMWDFPGVTDQICVSCIGRRILYH